MSELWAELWERPGHATFGRVHDFIPATSQGLVDGLNRIGGGNLEIPDSWSGFNDVLYTDPVTPANSVSSLVRVYSAKDPTVPIFEWLPTDLIPGADKNDREVSASGSGIKSILSYARLEPWDWDGNDDYSPQVPDWVYGGPDILQNGDFETTPFPNGGFEDGNNDYWQITTNNGFLTAALSVIAVNDPGNAQTGDWYGLVDLGTVAKSGAVRTFSGLVVGSQYTITGFLKDPSASGDRFRSGISDAVSASHTNAYEADGYWWAEIDNAPAGTGASDGTWQSFTLTFVAGEESIQLVIIQDALTPPPVMWIDTWALSGDGVGLYPWVPVYPANTNLFQYQTAIVDTGVGALEWQATDFEFTSPFGVTSYGHVGARQPVNLKVGQPYTMSVRLRQTSGSNANFVLGASRQSPIGVPSSPGSFYMNSVVVSVATSTWTTLTLSFVADVSEGWFEVRYLGSLGDEASPNTYLDNAHLYEGLPVTTVGDILTDLYNDATIDHSGRVVWEDDANPGTPYLTLDFTPTLDSDGAAWVDSDIAIRLTMRMSYSQIMAGFASSYGYEYRIVPDDPELGTWLWQVYNPGTMGTSYAAAAGPAIQGGSADVSRSVRRFAPGATDTLVEGQARVTARDRNTNLVTALGRIEGSLLNREASDLSSTIQTAAETVAGELTAGRSYSYTLGGTLPDEPLSDYLIGDTLNIVDPPEVTVAPARLVGVVATITPESVLWEVQFGSVSVADADTAVAEAVAFLMGKFEYPDQLGGGAATAVPGGEGAAPTLVVAASDSSEFSKGRSDYICTGTSDEVVIMTAMGLIHAAGGGRLLLCEGTFNIAPDVLIVGFTSSGSQEIIMQGLGEASEINIVGANTTFGVRVANRSKLRDFRFNDDGGTATIQVDARAELANLFLFGTSDIGIRITGIRASVNRMHIAGGHDTADIAVEGGNNHLSDLLLFPQTVGVLVSGNENVITQVTALPVAT